MSPCISRPNLHEPTCSSSSTTTIQQFNRSTFAGFVSRPSTVRPPLFREMDRPPLSLFYSPLPKKTNRTTVCLRTPPTGACLRGSQPFPRVQINSVRHTGHGCKPLVRSVADAQCRDTCCHQEKFEQAALLASNGRNHLQLIVCVCV